MSPTLSIHAHRYTHRHTRTDTSTNLEAALMITHSDTLWKETIKVKSQKFFIGLSRVYWVVSERFKSLPLKVYARNFFFQS